MGWKGQRRPEPHPIFFLGASKTRPLLFSSPPAQQSTQNTPSTTPLHTNPHYIWTAPVQCTYFLPKKPSALWKWPKARVGLAAQIQRFAMPVQLSTDPYDMIDEPSVVLRLPGSRGLVQFSTRQRGGGHHVWGDDSARASGGPEPPNTQTPSPNLDQKLGSAKITFEYAAGRHGTPPDPRVPLTNQPLLNEACDACAVQLLPPCVLTDIPCRRDLRDMPDVLGGRGAVSGAARLLPGANGTYSCATGGVLTVHPGYGRGSPDTRGGRGETSGFRGLSRGACGTSPGAARMVGLRLYQEGNDLRVCFWEAQNWGGYLVLLLRYEGKIGTRSLAVVVAVVGSGWLILFPGGLWWLLLFLDGLVASFKLKEIFGRREGFRI